MSTTLSDPPALARFKALLNKALRIVINDGRIFIGTFAGTDKQLNILLVNTDEYRLSPVEHANPDGRFVGLIMVPRRFILSVETPRGSGVSEDRDDLYP